MFHGGWSIGDRQTEDCRHTRSLTKARSTAWLKPHNNNGTPGGLVRAATASRLPNGKFARNGTPQPKRDRLVAKALARVIAAQKEQRRAKEANLRIAPEDPDINGAAAELRAALVEAQTRTFDSPMSSAANNSSAVTTAESFGEAEELLEEIVIALLQAPNPFNKADKTDSLWTLVCGALSDELYDRFDTWVEKRMTSTE
jgi:hypothetical protein